ncbi:MAG TPA: ATP-binding protein [Candidatus Saccharimonadales bacterium]|nr:ATP-binding protein [Candidatus Saccharimonadales bacterium]
MDYLDRFVRGFRNRLFGLLVLNNVLIIADYFIVEKIVKLTGWWSLAALLAAPILTVSLLPWLTTHTLVQPTKLIWQAILHIAPQTANHVGAPKPEQIRFGRELVTNLINQVYQLASVVDGVEKTSQKTAQDLHSSFVANSLPLPLLVLDKEEKIVYANDATAKYLHQTAADLTGQSIYTRLDMSFISDDTLASWLKTTKGKAVTADHKWERVRIGLPGQKDSFQFDLAAHYNQNNSLGYETLLILFDHTEVYAQDDQAMSFVALSVHELRTPLTLLRGYIEVFDEELGPTLNTEMKAFMQKMNASAQQLAAFVDNILNVAKIEDNQLTLQLHEENWQNVIDTVVGDLNLRAGVRGITIKTDIAPELPSVGVDRYSIYEVLANLLDNAIKYSKGTNQIYVSATLNKDGLVETSVKDFGLGIDASILPHIFDKFYRNHRNRAQIGGTGLGLYLSRSIIDAHGGQIWVNSKVNEGSTFTFTVLPYTKVAESGKTSDTNGITRGAHGWIKNHSLYRD